MFDFINFILHYKPLLNPFIKINTLGNTLGINELKREVPIIVSLTADEESIDRL